MNLQKKKADKLQHKLDQLQKQQTSANTCTTDVAGDGDDNKVHTNTSPVVDCAMSSGGDGGGDGGGIKLEISRNADLSHFNSNTTTSSSKPIAKLKLKMNLSRTDSMTSSSPDHQQCSYLSTPQPTTSSPRLTPVARKGSLDRNTMDESPAFDHRIKSQESIDIKPSSIHNSDTTTTTGQQSPFEALSQPGSSQRPSNAYPTPTTSALAEGSGSRGHPPSPHQPTTATSSAYPTPTTSAGKVPAASYPTPSRSRPIQATRLFPEATPTISNHSPSTTPTTSQPLMQKLKIKVSTHQLYIPDIFIYYNILVFFYSIYILLNNSMFSL